MSVILLHGAGAAVESWETLLPALCPLFHVYAFDFIGFGKSSKPNLAYSLMALTDLLAAFVNLHQISRLSLIGHSMGGGIALLYTIIYGNTAVDKLVLIASAGFGPARWWFRLISSRKLIPIMATCLGNDVLGPRLFRKIYGPNISEYSIKKLSSYWKNPLVAQAYAMCVEASHKVTVIPGLESIEQPCLVIWGGKDKIVSPRHSYVAQEKLKNCKLYILPGAGHGVYAENPQEVNKLIVDFLKDDIFY